MAILYNLMAKAGEYTNSKGETKVRWHRCGVAIESKAESGMALNIESLPTNFDGWLQLYKPTERDQNGNQSGGQTNNLPSSIDDEIPF